MATLPSQEMVSGRGIDTGDRESEGMAAPTNLDRPSPRDCEHTSPEFKGHAFLHIFTQERIPRLLRPIKAKIAAIHHAIKTAPSMGYIAVTQPPPLRSDSDRDSKSPVAERSSFRKAATMSAGHSYQIRSTRSSRNRFPECSASGSTITHSRNEIKKICPEPSTVPTHPTILSTANANDLHTRGDLLIKRFRTPLRDLFQDLVEKTWWHPFCDDHGIPRKTSPTSPTARRLLGGNRAVMSSLAVSCAFEVGRVVGHLAEDDVKTVEKYYGIVPSHLTRHCMLYSICYNAKMGLFALITVGHMSLRGGSGAKMNGSTL
ncbi:hypothetical protein BGW38_009726 [Lunasporangiospora selenospora]|uniref:Uncharacterized protein n=1 Tax=Lunasporangiospora selenospora TaxID=979761 RepID=A0A9P6FWU6_9FUNG|nr:hypothetical protein BGW38_009726 [Lunasporangiospora selenospora]